GQHQPRRRRELKTPWWETQHQPKHAPSQAPQPVPAPAASDTSAFFSRRSGAADATPAPAAPAGPAPDDDVIYQRMLSEMMGDPRELVHSPDLDWQSVWDRGWSVAAEAQDKPVESRTDHGLPVRTPGARLVPGAAQADQVETGQRRLAQHAAARDPDAVRASMSSHFDGVRTGRAHARKTSQEPNQE
ncbi:ATP-binding protein, partial [Mycobacterium simiae]